MEAEVFKQISTYGAFAILFFFLLVYVLRKNDEREKRYINTIEKDQDIIKTLSDKISITEDINRKIDRIEADVRDIKINSGGVKNGR